MQGQRRPRADPLDDGAADQRGRPADPAVRRLGAAGLGLGRARPGDGPSVSDHARPWTSPRRARRARTRSCPSEPTTDIAFDGERGDADRAGRGAGGRPRGSRCSAPVEQSRPALFTLARSVRNLAALKGNGPGSARALVARGRGPRDALDRPTRPGRRRGRRRERRVPRRGAGGRIGVRSHLPQPDDGRLRLPSRIVMRVRRDVPLALLDALIVVPAYLIPLVLRLHGNVPPDRWRGFWLVLPGHRAGASAEQLLVRALRADVAVRQRAGGPARAPVRTHELRARARAGLHARAIARGRCRCRWRSWAASRR